jgi:hypothetical protein
MRARNIKPGVFKNEVLGTEDPILTLLFEGLWCMADREGRLEDRPLRIKAEIFPYRESLDIHRYLTELERMGFVRRYKASGIALIQVLNFKKHQNPHHTEKESELPAPVDSPLDNSECPADSLIPDSLIPDKKPSPEPKISSGSVAPSRKKKPMRTPLPQNFGISDAVRKWAQKNGYSMLEEHLEHFIGYVKANGKIYADWDQALQNAIRQDWARLRASNNSRGKGHCNGTQVTSISAVDQVRKSLAAPVCSRVQGAIE